MKSKLFTYKNLASTLWGFHHSKIILNNTPLITNIEVTSRCNLKCSMCIRERVEQTRGFGDMSMKLFQKIVDENKRCFQDVMLFNIGEPLMNPHFIDMVQYIQPYVKRKLGFTTNGILLLPEKMRELVEVGVNIVCFSLEPKDIYRKLRGVDSSIVENNIENILQLNLSNVTYQTNTLIVEGYEEIYAQFFARWKRKIPFQTTSPIQPHLENLPCGSGLKEPCSAFWIGGRVWYNGEVAPCCAWCEEPICNLNEASFVEQWNNKQFIEMRKLHNIDRRLHEWCGRCKGHAFNPQSIYGLNRSRLFPFNLRFLSLLGGNKET